MVTRDSDGLRIAGLSLDCEVPTNLIQFYVDLLGGELLWRKYGSLEHVFPGCCS